MNFNSSSVVDFVDSVCLSDDTSAPFNPVKDSGGRLLPSGPLQSALLTAAHSDTD